MFNDIRSKDIRNYLRSVLRDMIKAILELVSDTVILEVFENEHHVLVAIPLLAVILTSFHAQAILVLLLRIYIVRIVEAFRVVAVAIVTVLTSCI